ncbi:MAG: hypothetical protein U0N90_04585 [Blautia sp.]
MEAITKRHTRQSYYDLNYGWKRIIILLITLWERKSAKAGKET